MFLNYSMSIRIGEKQNRIRNLKFSAYHKTTERWENHKSKSCIYDAHTLIPIITGVTK